MAKKTKNEEVVVDTALSALIAPQSDKKVIITLDFDNSIIEDPITKLCFDTWDKENFEIHVLEEDDIKHLFDKLTKYKSSIEKEEFIANIIKQAGATYRAKSTYICKDGTEIEVPLKYFKFKKLIHKTCTVNYIVSEKNEDFAFIKEFKTVKNLPYFFVITDVEPEEELNGLILVKPLKDLTNEELIDIIKQEIVYANREKLERIRWYNVRQEDFKNDGLVCHIGE